MLSVPVYIGSVFMCWCVGVDVCICERENVCMCVRETVSVWMCVSICECVCVFVCMHMSEANITYHSSGAVHFNF